MITWRKWRETLFLLTDFVAHDRKDNGLALHFATSDFLAAADVIEELYLNPLIYIPWSSFSPYRT